MKQTSLTPLFVNPFIPEQLEEGTLYISLKYQIAIHLCCCGCGEQTVTPVSQGWTITGTDQVTIRPSILNTWCNSHYYVTNNNVDWL